MAVAKRATVVAERRITADTRVLTLELAEPLGFVGGQYLIFDPGIVLESGKIAKRAYSILSRDTEQRRVEVAIKRIGDGPGSSFMHRAAPGDQLPFSGPWGKYLPDDSRPRATWVIATDTAITCALGLVGGERFAPQRPLTEVLWLVERDDYFLPEALVRERLPPGLASFRVARALPVDHPERLAEARALVVDLLATKPRPESVFLSGDGALIFPLREQLVAAGLPDGSVRAESYFHHQARKSA